MADVTPAPIPLERPISIMNSGVTKPTAARAFPPNPETQMASTRLYMDDKTMATIRGPDNFITAFLGSPVIKETPSVISEEGGSLDLLFCTLITLKI
jgi:hypothetical protein